MIAEADQVQQFASQLIVLLQLVTLLLLLLHAAKLGGVKHLGW